MSPTLTRGAGRLLRGGVAGIATGTLALLAHAEAGAALPDPALFVPPVLLMGLVAAGLGGRERGPWTILALVGAGQLAMHTLLSMTVSHARSHGHGNDNPEFMLFAHVLATLVVVTVLTGAERAVFLLFAVLTSRLPRRLTPLPATAPLRLAPLAPIPPSPVSSVLRRRVQTRRGPPSHS
ncbi:hypothetical protein SAMN05216266_101108 [Amycolatopsis marina]|uniref:Uncharacterized protein n=1 Tax=Amycolatopsis marina TaxID=490629 RepID=A0A1I0V9X4_9PSEU|nr:hypothetical protein [Amycolatopsis marina]SFA73184.1 hypothetical protein SAMN05216266_101108 [Amycolatopsis marina]